MANDYFSFKEFTIQQAECNMKVCTDSCLFGAWVSNDIYKNKKGNIDILDIGTGTGLLSLMLAQLNSNAKIDAVEIHSPSALQAKNNIFNSPYKNNIKVIEAGILEFQPSHNYDIIIVNPPFFAGSLKSPKESKNNTKHESELTLKLLVEYIKTHLKVDGFAYILLPHARTIEAEQTIKTAGMHISEKINVKQKEAGEYFRIMLKISNINLNEALVSEINIKISDNYSNEFTVLLKPFYLFL